MKKIVCILLCVVLVASLSSLLFACGDNIPRDELLKLYMPGEYIDEDIFADFSAWYEEQTGKKVTVRIKTFDAVENIQLAVEANKSDYDLLCPSDYMVEYLRKAHLLQEVDKTILDVTQEGLFKQEYLETAREYDPKLEYSVPYMYGTLGLVYDITKTGKKITSWESFFGDEYKGNRSIKDSIRDAYAAACIYNARESLEGLEGLAQKAAIQAVFEDTSTGAVAQAKTTLERLKARGDVWDVDNIKFDMAANRTDVKIALMWSCDAGYVMNTYEDANGDEHEGNKNLWYVVPDEGGNVYIDNFVISKYAKNVEAANYFLKYLCTTDVAVKNSVYAGCISPVAQAYDEMYEKYTTDEEIYEDTMEGWKEMFLETMFPSLDTLNRCGVMKDFGKEGKERVTEMWGDLQG